MIRPNEGGEMYFSYLLIVFPGQAGASHVSGCGLGLSNPRVFWNGQVMHGNLPTSYIWINFVWRGQTFQRAYVRDWEQLYKMPTRSQFCYWGRYHHWMSSLYVLLQQYMILSIRPSYNTISAKTQDFFSDSCLHLSDLLQDWNFCLKDAGMVARQISHDLALIDLYCKIARPVHRHFWNKAGTVMAIFASERAIYISTEAKHETSWDFMNTMASEDSLSVLI